MSAFFQYSKIALQAVLLWTLFAGLGLVAIGGTAYLALLSQAPPHGRSGMTAVFLALLCLLMAIVYFVLANKLVMGFVLSRLLNMKLTQNLRDQLVLRLLAHPQWMNAVNSATNLKTALLQAIDSDSNMHSLLRRVVRYLLGRLNVDQLLGNPDKLKLTHQIADQLIEKAAQTAAPAYSHFVYALLVHAALVWFVM